MSNAARWMIYGANGYTGRLIAEKACRLGEKPVLAGRTAGPVAALAAELGLEHRVFTLSDAHRVADNLSGTSLVLHCAGPFSATAAVMMDGAIEAGVHYLDITGEIDVIEMGAARHDAARRAGVALMPAVGFDVVPTDCLAAILAHELPSAVRLELAFKSSGGLSPGTTKTMIEGLPRGGRARVDGRIVAVPPAWKTREIPFRSGKKLAMTIPWGDVASAYYSTGIPNIEVYLAASPSAIASARRMRHFGWLMGLAPMQALAKWWIGRTVKGPDPAHDATSRTSLWGQVTDAGGATAEATLETPGGYTFTVDSSLEVARRVASGKGPRGFATASQAFGREFVLTLPGVDLQWITRPRAAASA